SVVVSGPGHGTLSGSGATLTYTPAPDFNGTDGFTFRVNDGSLDSAPAEVSITVTAVNDAPTLDSVADVTIARDAPLQAVTLTGITAGPSNESAQGLTVTAVSSDPALLPDLSVSYTSPLSTAVLAF